MGFQKGNTFGRLRTGKPQGPMSEETKLKISAALKGKMPKNLNQLHENMFGEHNPMFGVPYTQEMRDARSRGLVEYWDRNPNRKAELSIIFSGENNPSWGKDMSEDRNANWKGDEVGYSGVHTWIEKWKGKPKKCENCGTENAKKFEWANIDHKYRRVLQDYIRMCTSCHRNYDIENN